ncbi:MAG: alpha/beta hydrolase [Methylophaga sp.]
MKLLIMLLLFVSPVEAQESAPWKRMLFTGGNHMVMGFAPATLHFTDTLNIFIEGDGKPGIALDLVRSTGGNSVYLARPCQYLDGHRFNSCGKAVWTSHRYSQAVIDSMDRAITALKIRYRARTVRLIGFSGGGAVASIIATKRQDVALLVTVAGNLDHKCWTDYNASQPLAGSLNPIDFSKALEAVPQIHLIGERDDVVPGSVLTSYLSRLKKLDKVTSHIIVGANHTCCWSLAVAQVLE